MDNEVIGGWSVGFLGSQYQEYAPAPFNDWNQGFAHVEVEDNGIFHVHNKTIIDNKII